VGTRTYVCLVDLVELRATGEENRETRDEINIDDKKCYCIRLIRFYPIFNGKYFSLFIYLIIGDV